MQEIKVLIPFKETVTIKKTESLSGVILIGPYSANESVFTLNFERVGAS